MTTPQSFGGPLAPPWPPIATPLRRRVGPLHCRLNKITDKEGGSLVERVWSYKTCKIIRNLLAPTKLYDAEYSVIVDKVKPSSHRVLHNGSASVVAAGAKATPLECLVVVDLRRLAENCEFGVTLPDVLVCGVSNDRMHSGTVAHELEVR